MYTTNYTRLHSSAAVSRSQSHVFPRSASGYSHFYWPGWEDITPLHERESIHTLGWEPEISSIFFSIFCPWFVYVERCWHFSYLFYFCVCPYWRDRPSLPVQATTQEVRRTSPSGQQQQKVNHSPISLILGKAFVWDLRILYLSVRAEGGILDCSLKRGTSKSLSTMKCQNIRTARPRGINLDPTLLNTAYLITLKKKSPPWFQQSYICGKNGLVPGTHHVYNSSPAWSFMCHRRVPGNLHC